MVKTRTDKFCTSTKACVRSINVRLFRLITLDLRQSNYTLVIRTSCICLWCACERWWSPAIHVIICDFCVMLGRSFEFAIKQFSTKKKIINRTNARICDWHILYEGLSFHQMMRGHTFTLCCLEAKHNDDLLSIAEYTIWVGCRCVSDDVCVFFGLSKATMCAIMLRSWNNSNDGGSWLIEIHIGVIQKPHVRVAA